MSASDQPVDTIWFTRCPVPTATGLAYKLGWLDEEFKPDGIAVKTLQEVGGELARHHYDHGLNTLIREGGNLLAIPAKGQGAPTKLVGLTWIDEAQAILVRPDSTIRKPTDLKGKRLALPSFRAEDLANNRRGRSIARGMSLAGYKGVLASVGLSLDDIHLVEVNSERQSQNLGSLWGGLEPLIKGEVDAIYVKGASSVDAARQHGAVVAIDIDKLPDRRFRVNNGTRARSPSTKTCSKTTSTCWCASSIKPCGPPNGPRPTWPACRRFCRARRGPAAKASRRLTATASTRPSPRICPPSASNCSGSRKISNWCMAFSTAISIMTPGSTGVRW